MLGVAYRRAHIFAVLANIVSPFLAGYAAGLFNEPNSVTAVLPDKQTEIDLPLLRVEDADLSLIHI